MQSFLFALGLERMITNRPAQAVTSAMRDRLIYDAATKAETAVLSSWVSLEIEGEQGTRATVTRWVKDDDIDAGLVRVVTGPALTDPDDYPVQDYYVGRAGAAQNPFGFHRWLADFIGWELPLLTATDGRQVPLYMEQVFPLLFVEQRRGWGGIQAQMPYFSGVPDVKRRAIEFLLRLDVGQIESEKLRLRAEEKSLQDNWRAAVRLFKESIANDGLILIGIPEKLTVAWPPPTNPVLAESVGRDWVPVERVIEDAIRSQVELDAIGTREVDGAANEFEADLSAALEESDAIRQTSAVLREQVLRDESELELVRSRVLALKEDLREHQDILKLENLGSASLARLHEDCPVCHQQIPASLLRAESPLQTSSTQESVDYIQQQIELFTVMERDTAQVLDANRERLAALRRRAAEARHRIRSIRSTLIAPGESPAEEDVARRIRLQERIHQLKSVTERFYVLLGELERLSEQGRRVRGSLANLPKDRLSDPDQNKLSVLERVFIDQLRSYDFGSFRDERLGISRDDYLPRRDDFDLQADISASDSIRVVWAYLLGLLETARTTDTNHPGLLIFDEPRQQSAKEVSFSALLERAANDDGNRQIIFATSEELGSLQRMLAGVPHQLHVVDGYVLKPLAE
ncbi:hypothetical protein HFP15_28285 [Amycolatopsis sp. K13G38]|uniref:Rad50/SbcC-type AAA domain-containing protein n=1 Tax=Amycolatopsis acididurans TaxID=2724524 RepID=A0ABX1JE59_9PSEU|nr:hypothetical protein [Amycolatopsis acididurans]NKQ56776.1 hypothetical protein [Amycolatopsis acididurans]